MSEKTIIKQIKKEIMNEDVDYEYIYENLEENLEETLSAILNCTRSLFKKIEEEDKKEKINNLMELLNEYIKNNKNKNNMEIVYDKIEVFLDNIGKSFDYKQIFLLEKNISSLIEIQNKCLLNPMKKNNGERYNFMKYLIFDNRDVELLGRYIVENMKELLISNSLVPSIFASIIEKYITIDEDNQIEINYFNQVINIFLDSKLYNKLFKDFSNNEILTILKSSNKSFVNSLVERIENGLYITKEELASVYGISFDFPNDLEKYTYTNNGLANFTNQNIISIDGDDSLCLDDALFIEENKNGTYTLYIHLSNPPSIIPYHSNTMKEALKRCKNIYLEDTNIPIFEDYLTYDMLSLLPNKKTNTFTFIVDVSSDYSLLLDTVRIIPGVVVNKNRLTYEEADKMIASNQNDNISWQLKNLYEVFSRISKENLRVRAYHKLENFVRGQNDTNSAKADTSMSHFIVEHSMVLANTMPYILDKYHNLNLILPWRVQNEVTDEMISDILSNIDNVNPNSQIFRNIIKNSLLTSKYSPVNTGHKGLGLEGYVRVGSAARRAMDALAQYSLYDLYLNRNQGDLDIKYYFWEKEIKYWCDYANNRTSENNNFIAAYNYLSSHGKILKK